MCVHRRAVVFLALALLAGPLAAAAPAQAPGPAGQAGRPGSGVDFDGVLRLLREGENVNKIIRQVEESPTAFVLSPEQIKQLEKAGANTLLIEAMQAKAGRRPAPDVTNFAVILDCSASMKDKIPDGRTKMEAAKEAVTRLINAIPNGKRLAFVVYGHNLRQECKA